MSSPFYFFINSVSDFLTLSFKMLKINFDFFSGVKLHFKLISNSLARSVPKCFIFSQIETSLRFRYKKLINEHSINSFNF